MAIEEQIRDLQGRIQQEQARRARAEVQKDNAEKAIAESREALKTEFGVTTGPEIKEKRAALQEELTAALAEAEQLLEAAGA